MYKRKTVKMPLQMVWTKEVDEYIRAHYTKMSDQEIANELSRILSKVITPCAVKWRRLRSLKLRRRHGLDFVGAYLFITVKELKEQLKSMKGNDFLFKYSVHKGYILLYFYVSNGKGKEKEKKIVRINCETIKKLVEKGMEKSDVTGVVCVVRKKGGPKFENYFQDEMEQVD